MRSKPKVVAPGSRPLNLYTRGSGLGMSYGGRLVHPEWIDPNLVRYWKERCDHLHGQKCTDDWFGALFASVHPAYLIDCWRQCLVPAPETSSYVALSYVWGDAKSFVTRKDNLEQLQQMNALARPDICLQIPRTIRDAIALTEFLRERYLWVDSLCIVQDDELQKHTDIRSMAALFANAKLTIVSTCGHADYGLRGLRGISKSRCFIQKTIRMGRSDTLVCQRHRWSNLLANVWKTRGWTFQEDIFSRRRLIFHDDTVFWECDRAEWNEGVRHTEHGGDYNSYEPYGLRRRIIAERFPNMTGLAFLVIRYNTRNLTFLEDAHNAFAGILSVLSQSFKGGFIYGLPVLLFDIGLLWQPFGKVIHRTTKSTSKSFPSWSWTAWKGSIEMFSWYSGDAHIKKSLHVPPGVQCPVIPLMAWYVQRTVDSEKLRIQSDWFQYQEKYKNNTTCPLPKGWRRSKYVPEESPSDYVERQFPWPEVAPLCFYKHESDSESEYWYPLPVTEAADEVFVSDSLPLLSCHTRRAWLRAGEPLGCPPQYQNTRAPTTCLRDRDGLWIGALQLHDDPQPDFVGRSVELAEISRSYILESALGCFFESRLQRVFGEWNHAERPRAAKIYHFYNVICIEWEDGVAYRRGLGRVEKGRWEALDREWFDLTLG